MTTAIQIREWRPLRKGALLGFATVELPSGMIVIGVTVLAGNNGPWVSPPSKPMIGRDGAALTDANGKPKYSPILDFISKETRQRFSDAVIEGMRVAHPEVFI